MRRLHKWEQLALQGDFSAIPTPFTFDQSDRFGHFLNGYEAAGGMDQLAHLSLAMSGQARKNQPTELTAHRLSRLSGLPLAWIDQAALLGF
ncbi:hypothetical protein BQ8794_130076 [Mesorhizobium prunaredense]|uniref:Uncharacterized protein n=1 Tax=Mesorhizobium prunaredense TaxID=1631249 RepID=A0A1R3V116_9HYPH|nr:hypothetical protein [Mesorhizobium prunaredense]SIT53592.1 hypothetical protein BQ8794_130076 [Mesorhizobium prunaredense]